MGEPEKIALTLIAFILTIFTIVGVGIYLFARLIF